MSPDQFIEMLFDQKTFTIFFGSLLWFVLVWTLDGNKVERRRNARLKEADSKQERANIMSDPKYQFNAKEWLRDQKNDFIAVLLVAIALIELDDVVIHLLQKNYNIQIQEFSNAVYFLAGPVTDLMLKLISKIRS